MNSDIAPEADGTSPRLLIRSAMDDHPTQAGLAANEMGDPIRRPIQHHPACDPVFGRRTNIVAVSRACRRRWSHAPCPVPGGATARLIRGLFVLRGELGNTDTVSTHATQKAIVPRYSLSAATRCSRSAGWSLLAFT